MASRPKLKTYFPQNIELKSSPLVEAWLEVRWKISKEDQPGFGTDERYPFALGPFYESIKARFPHAEDREASRAPIDLLPHVVRHQFRVSKNGSPMLQLGPGVASANYIKEYTWKDFKKTAEYLRAKLLDAYSGELTAELLALRYRNAIPFEYSSENLLSYLKEYLNTEIVLPRFLPGKLSDSEFPATANVTFSFTLPYPKGIGSVTIASGFKKDADAETKEIKQSEHLLFELEVISKENIESLLKDRAAFADWLTASHTIIHEWFFSLIDGRLRREFEGTHDGTV